MNTEEKFGKRIIDILKRCDGIEDPPQYYRKLKELSEHIVKSKDFSFILKITEALANPDRLTILFSLLEKDRCACEFEAIIGKSQPAVSRNLKILENAGLIIGWKKGKFIHYSIVKSTLVSFVDVLRQILDTGSNWFDFTRE